VWKVATPTSLVGSSREATARSPQPTCQCDIALPSSPARDDPSLKREEMGKHAGRIRFLYRHSWTLRRCATSTRAGLRGFVRDLCAVNPRHVRVLVRFGNIPSVSKGSRICRVLYDEMLQHSRLRLQSRLNQGFALVVAYRDAHRAEYRGEASESQTSNGYDEPRVL
jgi:hypothetical protein